MTHPPYQVIVVDDDLNTAEEYARLIQLETGLLAGFTDDPDQAIMMVRTDKVSVAVLDQRMPKKTGNDLYREMIIHQPFLRAIMITGHANEDEVAEALNLGFNKHLKKERVLQTLPIAVLHQYAEYRASFVSRQIAESQPVIFSHRTAFWRRPVINYRLLNIEVLDPEHKFDNHWEEIITIQAGHSERIKISSTFEQTVVIESEATSRLGATLGLDVKKTLAFAAKLESELTQRYKQSTTQRITAQSEVERTFQVPPEPDDITKVHVRARRIQQAPVFQKVIVNMLAECGCCDRPNLVPLQAFVPTGGVALRHIDYYSDGTSRILELGITPG